MFLKVKYAGLAVGDERLIQRAATWSQRQIVFEGPSSSPFPVLETLTPGFET